LGGARGEIEVRSRSDIAAARFASLSPKWAKLSSTGPVSHPS